LVIDLTNTDRYYDRADVETLDIAYTKLYCPGHEVNGREDIVKQFIKRVDKFLSDNNDNDMWIGVHCTHGINRTGYLISRYLIDRQEWTSHAALEAFEKARGYPIERGNYVQSLHAAAKNRKSSTKRHSRKSPVVVSEGDDAASEEDSKLSAAKRGRRSEQQKTKKTRHIDGAECDGNATDVANDDENLGTNDIRSSCRTRQPIEYVQRR